MFCVCFVVVSCFVSLLFRALSCALMSEECRDLFFQEVHDIDNDELTAHTHSVDQESQVSYHHFSVKADPSVPVDELLERVRTATGDPSVEIMTTLRCAKSDGTHVDVYMQVRPEVGTVSEVGKRTLKRQIQELQAIDGWFFFWLVSQSLVGKSIFYLVRHGHGLDGEQKGDPT